ncbi:MAG TPA: PEP-utilizing enzyme, partial [Anaerolineaceae bacterium]
TFFVVRLLAIVRWALLDLGAEFVQAGELTQPDDLCYLTFSELEAFARSPVQDAAGGTAWPELIRGRRAAYEREMLRRQVPRLLLSDGRAFYEGVASSAEEGSTITGSPVSPGSAEGRVRVVLDPRRARLEPGEILVCPGTDPSWTPLFLTAAGLVMEVGGMMTHGSVVAREYGIPAVVGVHEATSRLKTGQRIRVDGTVGTITLLDADNQPHPV